MQNTIPGMFAVFDLINPEPARRRWVPDTSKAAHREAMSKEAK